MGSALRRSLGGIVSLLLLLLLGTLVASCGGDGSDASPADPASATPVPSPSPANQEHLLFVVQAVAGRVISDVRDPVRTLRFDGVDPTLLAFADRPVRIAAAEPTATLFADWATYGFAAVPPNAAIVVAGGAVREPIAIELHDPRYDAAAGTLEVDVASLAGDADSALRALLDASGRDGRSVVLFVDATSAAPAPGAGTPADTAAFVALVGQLAGMTFTPEQNDVLARGVAALVAVTASDAQRADPALTAGNVALFLANVQQVLGVTFSTSDTRLLTRALLRLLANA